MLAVSRSAWIDWGWLADNVGDLWPPLREHVVLTLLSLLGGMVVSVPAALAARRWRRLSGPILGAAGVLYTIPALALFALLIPWTGLSRTTALLPLVSYTLLILIRAIVDGLDGVPAPIVETATAMGYGPLRRLLRVELPLALPTILAGVRLAAVSTVGLVTVAGLIGFANLGNFMLISGFQRNFLTPITVGALTTVALAVVADRVLAGVGVLAMPWRRTPRRTGDRHRDRSGNNGNNGNGNGNGRDRDEAAG